MDTQGLRRKLKVADTRPSQVRRHQWLNMLYNHLWQDVTFVWFFVEMSVESEVSASTCAHASLPVCAWVSAKVCLNNGLCAVKIKHVTSAFDSLYSLQTSSLSRPFSFSGLEVRIYSLCQIHISQNNVEFIIVTISGQNGEGS